MGLHERLGDKAIGRADECECDDDRDLARRAGKRETAKGECGDTREQAAKAQLPNAGASGSTSSTKRFATMIWPA